MTAQRSGVLAAVCTVFCWASAFAAVKIGLREFSPLEMTFVRLVSASISLGLICLISKESLPKVKDLPAFAALGLVGHALYSPVLSLGLTRVPASTASFIIASAPIFMVLIGRFTTIERMSFYAKIGMGVSLFGVAMVSLGRGGLDKFDWYAVIVVVAALLQASYSMGQRPMLQRYSGLQVITFSAMFATLFLTPWAMPAWGKVTHGTLAPLLCTVYMGVVTTGIGYWTWALAVKRLPVAKAGAFLYTVPAVAVFLAWLILHETPQLLSVLGGVLIIGGVVLVQQLGQNMPIKE